MKSEFKRYKDHKVLSMGTDIDYITFSSKGEIETDCAYCGIFFITPDNAREIIKIMEAIIKEEDEKNAFEADHHQREG